jgi:solute carrier family 25 carnitine/acylcarnitine transporter 20/29
MTDNAKPVAVHSALADFLAGGFGGICLVAVGHPLDTIKVRLQTSSQYKGFLDCAIKTLKNESIFGFYRGMAAPIIGVTPMYAVGFFGYGIGQQLQRHSPDQQLNLHQIGLAGGLSGIFTTAIMTPGERVKVLLQTQDPKNIKYKGPVDVIRKMWAETGIMGIYKGTAATLLRDIPGSYAYFAAYEYFKRTLSDGSGKLNPWATLFSGGMAGVCNWLVSIPADVLKSRLQSAPEGTYPRGMRDVFVDLMKKEGPLGLYKGIVPVMIRAFPANAACFLGVELAYKALSYVGI